MALVNYINVLFSLFVKIVKKIGIIKNIFIRVRVHLFKKVPPNN